MKVKVGCGQITWRGVPEESVLADIGAAGYEGAPMSLRGDRSAAEITQAYAQHGPAIWAATSGMPASTTTT